MLSASHCGAQVSDKCKAKNLYLQSAVVIGIYGIGSTLSLLLFTHVSFALKALSRTKAVLPKTQLIKFLIQNCFFECFFS